MVSLLRKLVPSSEYRRLLGSVVVIAANAGGAWTPIGDVTTAMLWIHGQISTLQTMKDLFLPSVVSLAVPLTLLSFTREVKGYGYESSVVLESEQMAPRGKIVFSVGVGALIFVPVFKALTGLPPYMGMLLGLGVIWILTDAIHYGKSERKDLKVPQALSRIDSQGAVFFLGILLSVSSLEATGLLRQLAKYLDAHIPNAELIASAIGMASAIIDNVPLVAATIGMYDLTYFAQDSRFWQLVAFCAGTGGSMLVLGSAAGVALMAMEKVDFLWYLKKAPATNTVVLELTQAYAEASETVFFLLSAMTIVETVDAHQGFMIVTDKITTRKPRTLLWVIGFVTFFMSSILDNLTSTIVMVSLLKKLLPPSEYRKLLGAVVVIAANAGGAWTPIGDVTTTMLWMHGQISTFRTIKDLFLPSVVSLAVPLTLLSFTSEVNGNENDSSVVVASEQLAPRGQLVFSVGIGVLIFVPVFKTLTGLPPYMGMLLGLGVLWILTDAFHHGESERQRLKVPQALSRIDTQGALFFLGILLSTSSLGAAGILQEFANYLDAHIPNVKLIATAIGIVSAIVDNVPLVAATMGMYDLTSITQDSEFWQLVAYCAGTGGSMLVIGSAAGVAFMGMEKVEFLWYLRKVSGFAFAGYAAGIGAYVAAQNIHIFAPPVGTYSSEQIQYQSQ